MFIPPVVVKLDIERDVQEFLKFLYRSSPEKQKLILRTYPDLDAAVQLGGDAGQKVVADFVRDQYCANQDQIEVLVADMEKQVRANGARVLKSLGEVMEYSWTDDDGGYTVIPTLLPFSPFQQPVFFFSLTRFLHVKAQSVATDYGLMAVLAHEISHFIFFDILGQMPEKIHTKCDKTVRHFAQEILAPVVMNDPRLNGILHLTNYGGNPFLKHVTVRRGAKEQNIVAFFQAEYERKRTNSVSFKEFVSYLIETLYVIHSELQERLSLRDTYGSSLLSDIKLNAQYCNPIEVHE